MSRPSLHRWDAVEALVEGATELAGGVTKGSGPWGVSTLNDNPVTGGPYVQRFHTEAEAVDYARDRAMSTGIPLRPSGESGTESGRVMYVLHFSVDNPDGGLVYRVLRGHRGVRQERGSSTPGTSQEQVLVFRNGGLLPNDRTRWVLDKGLTLDVEDTEVEREKAKRARGPKAMTRPERYGDPEELFDPSARPRQAKAGPGRSLSPEEVANVRGRRTEERVEREQKLLERIKELSYMKDHLESEFTRTHESRTLRHLKAVEERIALLEESLRAR